ncbi:anaphase-promoting complex subunit 11 [Globomyces pollinis-pini]|nr:anaphase-promoting complex subunit 11 [Globomyces pollinis-pini]KAJ2998760.1 Anaphase promoting complex subunit 11 [Globomyces sp. JEL0801]
MGLKVKIHSWREVAVWKWNVDEEVCGICQGPFEGTCPGCKVPGNDCPLLWGECTHVFHMHCILKWLATPASKGLCPMDRMEWKDKT